MASARLNDCYYNNPLRSSPPHTLHTKRPTEARAYRLSWHLSMSVDTGSVDAVGWHRCYVTQGLEHTLVCSQSSYSPPLEQCRLELPQQGGSGLAIPHRAHCSKIWCGSLDTEHMVHTCRRSCHQTQSAFKVAHNQAQHLIASSTWRQVYDDRS